MKEGATMSENESTTLPGGDIPASWGFHLLQELRRMEDRFESKIDATNARIDGLSMKMDAKFDAMDAKFEAKFKAVDAKFEAQDGKIDTLRREVDQKLNELRYWSGAGFVVILAAVVSSFFLLHP